jgi:L-ascorbate metabolism protein UlaG (beta-lactamase superfamily)
MPTPCRLTYVGGPTALIEFGGLRWLTDPTFDPAGSEYRTATYVLRKTQAPTMLPDVLGAVDVVLLSHDHHHDNLDRAGRRVLAEAPAVITTVDAAARLGGRCVGLLPWEHVDVPSLDGRIIRVTATPARHGPPEGDRGPVIGFVLAFADRPAASIYISGDTVWYDGIVEIGSRVTPAVALLFGGAARVWEVGPGHLTFTAREMVIAARALPDALIVPLHFEGWAHFSESAWEIEQAFAAAGLAHRLRLPVAGRASEFSL